ncbi:hypothetical protein [Youxingia wuxianensis]|uniref:Uncharacterized protein n=1 Tax=Youxingia wuxianensis TaxID=2763678 RepID=A0A926ETV2_9FIRM|nr:hypothetical protein [Youxingia wuxianensis]MBC8586239.1 hypothetical protein [Youxingia wuxianensis]
MKHLNIRKHLSFVLALLLCMSLTTTAFAAEERIVSDAEISAVIAEINKEYGTNIHILSAEELTSLGLPVSEPAPMTATELAQLEDTLRHIAETQIPQFKKTTQEANAVLASIEAAPANAAPFAELQSTSEPITATKEIDYATAGAVAYTSKTILGKTIWGEIQHGFCVTDTQQATWFRATNPTVTRTDSNRTLYWVGTGSYYSNVNGTQYYLYSGTQYASMSIDDYT